MKLKSIKFTLLILSAFLLTACTTNGTIKEDKFAATYPSQILSGDVYVLKSHEKIDGNIVGFDSTLVIEEDATVIGDINLFASKMEVAGRVAGEINLFGGEAHIQDSAIVTGSINRLGNKLDISDDALIYGGIKTFSSPDNDLPQDFKIPEGIGELIRPRTWVYFQIIRNFAFTFISMLVVYLFKEQTIRISQKIKNDPLVSWIVGFVSFLAIPIIALIMIITICLSPVGLILLIALSLTNLWSWTVLNLMVGNQLTKWLKLDWGEVGVAAAGSVVFGILLTLSSLIPFMSFMLSSFISAFGVGAIILHYLSKN